jgi:2-C-methyl-D-erythritol 2,4-cyclodiphosphate synthase
MRIGYGFDSHEFKKGVPLKIGGVQLPHDKGLSGHSDGDVLLHAITDALLGAVCAGDIGSHFPPSDPQWKGADSAVFIAEALRQVERAGYSIANVDSTLILQTPKIGSHAQQIREHIAELLNVGASQVSVKAKTPEGLGTEKTAIAHVVVLLTTRAEDSTRAMHEAEATPQTEVDAEVEKVLEKANHSKVALPKRK